MKADGEKIACLTCYDASFAVLLRQRRRRPGAGRRFARHGAPGTRHHRAGDHGRHRLSLAKRWRAGCIARSSSPTCRSRAIRPRTSRWRIRCASCRRAAREMVKLESGVEPDSRSSSSSRGTTSRCARTWDSSRSRCTRPAASACRAARTRPRKRMLDERARRWNPRAPTSCCSSAFPSELGKRITEALRRAGDRHRRGSRHRRTDPGALRRARHHHRAQAALRAEFHGRRGTNLEALRRYVQAVKQTSYPAPEHELPRVSAWHDRRPPSPRCASTWRAGTRRASAWCSCPPWATCTPGT